MFNRKKQRIMEMTNGYVPTSKSSLKSFCITLAKGDVKQAGELYDYYTKDMEDLPMFDPVPPSFMDNAKNTVTGVFGFLQDNKEGIGQVVDMVRGIIGKKSAAATVGEALPEING